MTEDLVSQEVLDLLSNLGLNSYERKLYVTLLSKGSSNAGTLSELSGVPRSRTYDVLESLEDKGFVILQNSNPIKYVAVSPEEALERSKQNLREEYESEIDRIDRIKDSDRVEELEELFEEGVETVPDAEMTGSIKGRHSMHQQLETMLRKASSEVNIFTSEKGLEEIVANHSDLLKEASDRGVNVRIAAPLGADGEETARTVSSFAEVRNVDHPELEGRFAVADNREALLALTHDDRTHPTQDTHMWTQSEHVSQEFLQPVFRKFWEDGKKLN